MQGTKTSQNKQIGNAVPVLLKILAEEIYDQLKVVDLFAGAGGLSLGFKKARIRCTFSCGD